MDADKLARYLEFNPAWKSFSVYIFGAVIFFAGPFINPEAPISPAVSELIASCFLAFVLVWRYTNVYRVSSEKLVHEFSFPKRGKKEVEINEIRRIDLRRGLTQRALGVAHVRIYIQGKEEPAIKLFGVPDPTGFRDLLVELGAGDERVTGAWRR
jgi:uncharacterized membrane protein YdbT with pleckstrin-like domain